MLVGNASNKATEVAISGDVTMANTGAVTIAADAVTYAKIQNVTAANTVLGRISSGAGVVEELTQANLRTIIAVADGSLSQNNFTNALKTKLDAIEASSTIDQTASEILTLIEDGVDSVHYKDASIDNEHLADNAVDSDEIAADAVITAKILNSNVTLAKLANIADDTVLGNISGGAAAPSALSAANLRTLLTVADGSLSQNSFTDADHTKLNGIAASATANQTASEILTLIEDGVDSVHYKNGSIDNEHLADDAVGADELAANAVVNASVAAGAAITFTKLEALDSTKILVGNASNVATEVAVSGDVTMANTGAVTIAADAVTYAKIQNVTATDRILGRDSSGAGIVEEIAPADVRTMLNVQESVSALFNDIDADIDASGVGVNVLVNNWDFTSGLAAINSAMSSGVFTTTAALAGKYLIIAKIQFKPNGLTDVADAASNDSRNYKLQILNYRNDGGGTPEDGTLVSFARVMNANYFGGYILETTAVIDYEAELRADTPLLFQKGNVFTLRLDNWPTDISNTPTLTYLNSLIQG